MVNMEKGLKYVRNLLIALVLCMSLSTGFTSEAATTSQKEACKQEILKMYYTADTSTHSIFKYWVSVSELQQIYNELHDGEGRVIMGAYLPSTNISYTYSWGVVKNINLSNNGNGALERYEKMTANMDTLLNGIEPEMTDLDKVLYLHDALVEMVSYGGNGEQKYMAGGALGEKKAVCSGYAKALNLLLNEVGLETDYVASATLDHGWSYVKLDGEWYHIDPTWDDTRSPQAGKTSRIYLLKNDMEMTGSHGAPVPKKVTEAADSQKYSNWFVHSVVGKMCYEDGLWYYVDQSGKYIMRSDIEGKVQERVADCSCWSAVSLVDVNGTDITINADGSQQVLVAGTIQETVQGSGSSNNTQAESNIPALAEVDLNDFSNWRTGMYHYQTGKYVTYDSRICLNFYVSCEASKEYQVSVSDSSYQVLIREMNANGNMVVSNNLKNGNSFVTNSNTCAMAISLYHPGNSSMRFADYEKLFADGFSLHITSDALEENVVEGSQPTDTDDLTAGSEANTDASGKSEEENGGLQLETLDFADFNNWRSGIYHWSTGKYMAYTQRICLIDYVTFSGKSYKAQISNPVFKLLVRELDADGNFIKTTTLTNGATFVPQDRTVYLGICLYRDAENGLTYESYRNMFQSGFYAKMVTK